MMHAQLYGVLPSRRLHFAFSVIVSSTGTWLMSQRRNLICACSMQALLMLLLMLLLLLLMLIPLSCCRHLSLDQLYMLLQLIQTRLHIMNALLLLLILHFFPLLLVISPTNTFTATAPPPVAR
jgi:hypothetical protein